MEYVVIIPAYNEEAIIHKTLDSIIGQTHPPIECIVVNDGSTDRTVAIVDKYSQKKDWIRLVNNDKAASRHQPGPKIIHAFYCGYEKIKNPAKMNVIVKLDADLTLQPDYFLRVMDAFKKDTTIGMAGGICYIHNGKRWVYEKVSEKDHLRGPIKAYRMECFRDIGGLKPAKGWDTLDELLAAYRGWKIEIIKDLKVLHHRPTGKVTGPKVFMQSGQVFYQLRYGFWISLLSCLKISLVRKPIILSGIYAFVGYAQSALTGKELLVDKAEGQFIRKYRISGIKKKMGMKP